MRTQIEASEHQWFNWTGFVGFRYEAVEISINTTEGLFSRNISDKFSFFTKILMSKKDKRPSFSFSNEKFMLGFLKVEHFLNFSALSREGNNANISSTYRL